jgi:transcriptional regulator with XRE-family HTH domain
MWAQSSAEVGKIVAAARRYRDLTQTQLAQAVGVTQNWLSEVENGKDTAQIGRILRVLSFLQVRLEVAEAPWLTQAGHKSQEAAAPAAAALGDILAAHVTTSPRRKKTAR